MFPKYLFGCKMACPWNGRIGSYGKDENLKGSKNRGFSIYQMNLYRDTLSILGLTTLRKVLLLNQDVILGRAS